MIIWFSGSGNSLSVARTLAEKTQDTLLHLNDAPAANLSGEKVIGLVYPTYSYDAPLKIKEMLGSIRFPKDAYLWIVVTGGSIGALLGMYLFRHKTQHRKFTLGVPAMP